jgi:hypothetical protein
MTQEVAWRCRRRAKTGSTESGGPRAVLAPLAQGFPVSRDYRGTANLAVSVRLSRLSLLALSRNWPERTQP